jgi:hypothetical protein
MKLKNWFYFYIPALLVTALSVWAFFVCLSVIGGGQ